MRFHILGKNKSSLPAFLLVTLEPDTAANSTMTLCHFRGSPHWIEARVTGTGVPNLGRVGHPSGAKLSSDWLPDLGVAGTCVRPGITLAMEGGKLEILGNHSTKPQISEFFLKLDHVVAGNCELDIFLLFASLLSFVASPPFFWKFIWRKRRVYTIRGPC
ncbi:hypothetical protein V8F33_009834 [Rhypophila sp. PSN 637]